MDVQGLLQQNKVILRKTQVQIVQFKNLCDNSNIIFNNY